MKENIPPDIHVDLSKKVAVVVGGTGSIGEAISRRLSECGAEVITAARSRKGNSRKNPVFMSVDVRSERSVKALSKKILRTYGNIDILVLAQGTQLRKPFHRISLKEWNRIIAGNLTGTFLVCKYFLPPMIKKRSGKVIGVTSLTSEIGIKNISAYAASKGGMSQFLKTLSVELAGHNITVNMIAPGRIETRMTGNLLQNSDLKNSSLDRIPMGRWGKPSDLAGAVLFYASESARYITGHTLIVDGGWLAGGGNPMG